MGVCRPIVSEKHEFTLRVRPFKVAAGDVIQNQMAFLQMPLSQGSFDGFLASQQPIHRRVTVHIHIHRTFRAAEFPQGAVLPLMTQSQFAAGVHHSTGDHRQAVVHPVFAPRVDRPIQAEFLGQRQHRSAGAIFLRVRRAQSLRRSFRDDLSPKGRLDQLQGRQAHSGESSVRGMFDPAFLPIGGANQSVVMAAVPLNFEVKGSWFLHNGHTIRLNIIYVNIIIQYNSLMYGYI